MREYDFENSIGYWICGASRMIHRAMNQELAPRGITYRQAQILSTLVREGAVTQVALAEWMGIEPPTVVRILDRMERDGWISRVANPNDRREKLVRIESKASRAWEQVVAVFLKLRAVAERGLSKQELQALRGLLEKIEGNFASHVEKNDESGAAPATRRPRKGK